MGFGGGGAVHDSVAAAKIGRDDFPTRPRRANDAGTAPLVTVQTCGDLRTIRRVVEGQPSTESPPQTVPVSSNVNSYPLAHLLRTPVRCVINTVIAQLLPAEIAPEIPPPPTPRSSHVSPQLCRPWSPSSPTTPSASIRPSGSFSTSGAATWAYAPCRPNPSPWRATWRSAPAMAPPSPPCAWSPPPSPRPTSWPATSLPAGTGACARR